MESERQDYYAYQSNNPLIKVEEKEESDPEDYYEEDESRNNSTKDIDQRKEEEKTEQPRSPMVVETGRTEFESVETPELKRYEEELEGKSSRVDT